jgi:hypothetical protein
MSDLLATRDELNGLGSRLNDLSGTVARHGEAIDTAKQDRRDLWAAIQLGREETLRLERMVNQIAIRVAGIATVATLAQAFIVWYFTKGAP